MLIDGKQLSTGEWSQFSEQHRKRWPVSWEELMWHKLSRHLFGLQLIIVKSFSKCIWLREEITHQFFVVGNWFFIYINWFLALTESDELTRNHSALVKQLVEAVLTIGSRLSEVDDSTVIVQGVSIQIDSLSVAFHIQLLNMWHELAQSLGVRQDGSCIVAGNTGIVESNQSHQHWQVLGDVVIFK